MPKFVELLRDKKLVLFSYSFTFVVFIVLFQFVYAELAQVNKSVSTLQQTQNQLQQTQDEFSRTYLESFYNDHLLLSQQFQLSDQLNKATTTLEELTAISENSEYLELTSVLDLYNEVSTALERNDNVGLDTSSYDMDTWGSLLLNKEYSSLQSEMTAAIDDLDTKYNDYLASLPPPPSQDPSQAGEGYSYTTVTTGQGSFGVYLIKAPLSSVKVVTASASGDTCKDNCPTKSLADHIRDNNGYAGINAGYFCPPDYAACSGKINSSDYAFYKTSSGKWLQKDALSWGDTGLATFNGHSAKFYKKSSDYGGGSVTAGLSNYPTLLDEGNVVVDNDKLTSYQKDVRGTRGAIGVGKENLYLALITGATVKEAAYVMQALGALDALNLDGGGSSAMYINGGYVVGPGRSLPNAIVLTK